MPEIRKEGEMMAASVHKGFLEVTRLCGGNASVIFYHIAHWVLRNHDQDKNCRDGKYWMYTSVKQLAKEPFGYMTENQIRYALKKLRDAGLILTGNYNRTQYDRTLWYTLSPKGYRIVDNCLMDEEKAPNANADNH